MSVLRGKRQLACMLALACAAAHAAPDLPEPPRLEIDALQPWQPARRDSAPWAPINASLMSSQRQVSSDGRSSALTEEGLRARLWWSRGALEFGVGVNWLAPGGLATDARPWSSVLGVRAALSARTSIVYETETASAWHNAETGGATPRTARVALEFKSKSPVGDLRSSLMRVQLSGDSALHFKPRGGGLQMSYRSSF